MGIRVKASGGASRLASARASCLRDSEPSRTARCGGLLQIERSILQQASLGPRHRTLRRNGLSRNATVTVRARVARRLGACVSRNADGRSGVSGAQHLQATTPAGLAVVSIGVGSSAPPASAATPVRRDTCSPSCVRAGMSAQAATPDASRLGRSGWTSPRSRWCRTDRWCSPCPRGYARSISAAAACPARSRALPHPGPRSPPSTLAPARLRTPAPTRDRTTHEASGAPIRRRRCSRAGGPRRIPDPLRGKVLL